MYYTHLSFFLSHNFVMIIAFISHESRAAVSSSLSHSRRPYIYVYSLGDLSTLTSYIIQMHVLIHLAALHSIVYYTLVYTVYCNLIKAIVIRDQAMFCPAHVRRITSLARYQFIRYVAVRARLCDNEMNLSRTGGSSVLQ